MIRFFHFGNGQILFFAVIATHLCLLATPFYFKWHYVALAIAIYFLTGCIGSSVVLHRYLSHRSWRCPQWLEFIGSFFVTIGLIGSTITWVSIHRAHHMHTDTPKDPHSPHFMHWFKVHFFTMYYKPRLKLAKDLVQRPMHRYMHRYYWLVNLAYLVFLYSVGGVAAALWAYAVPAVILWHAGSGINSLGHLLGSQPSSLKDQSRNNFLLAVFMWGEGWHNNHHRYPQRPSFQIQWYEFDPGGWIIKLFNLKQTKYYKDQFHNGGLSLPPPEV